MIPDVVRTRGISHFTHVEDNHMQPKHCHQWNKNSKIYAMEIAILMRWMGLNLI